MKCDLKTILKVGAILVVILAGGFLAFPQFRPALAALTPFALIALCPIILNMAVFGFLTGT